MSAIPIVIAVGGFVITQVHNQLSARKGAQSARSIGVYLKNLTDETLYLKSSGLDHGIWTASGPVPQSVGPNQVAAWMCESNGFMTGCEGWTNWSFGSINNEEKVFLRFDNPFAGSNSYSQSLKDGTTGYKISHEGGGGDNADVTFILERA